MALIANQHGFFERHRWLLWTSGILLVVVLVAAFRTRDDAVPVTAFTVTYSGIRSIVSTNGKVEAVGAFEAHAPVATTVEKLLVKEGDRVKKGQLLVELDDAGARSQRAGASSQVAASESAIQSMESGGSQEELLTLDSQLVKTRSVRDAARRNLEALERLERSGAASAGEVRAARDERARADADVKLLEEKQKQRYSASEIRKAQAEKGEAESAYAASVDLIRQLDIRAPFDGVVYSLPVHSGAYVNPGDLILQEADLSRVRVRAFVDEPDIARLGSGDAIEMTWDAIPGRTWKGTLHEVPTVLKLHGTRNVGETSCIVDNPDLKLLPNVNVDVAIVTSQDAHALTVPREALRQDDGKPYVLQIVNHELKRREVTTSVSTLTAVEVTSGISEGAVVALAATNLKPLYGGLTVRVVP
jgi:HlyD family secretion protein